MDVRYLAPDARRLDEANVELCVCSMWSDERPLRGFAGLLDWRLGGRLSALVRSEFVRGEAGEQLLVPGKPHVPFEKVLVVGLGPRRAFDGAAFRRSVALVARALEGLRVRSAVVELPGRAGEAIDPRDAIAWTLEQVGASPDHDVWWLVEDAASQRLVEQRAAEERRRVATG